MIISLTIFSVVVFPMMISTQTMDISRKGNDTSIITFEVSRMFDNIREEVNYSYRFLPFWWNNGILCSNWGSPCSPTYLFDYNTRLYNTSVSNIDRMPKNSVFYFAYQDPLTQKVVRLGYQLKEVKKSDGFSYSPKHWTLLKLNIPEDAWIEDLYIYAPGWTSVGKIKLNEKDFYMTGQNNTD